MPLQEQPEILFKINQADSRPMQNVLDELCIQCGLDLGCYRLTLDGLVVLSPRDLCHGDRLMLVPETNSDLIRIANLPKTLPDV
jgi:hypothetical protein